MRFPKIIRNRKTRIEVTIYGKSEGGERKEDGTLTQPYPFYRVCWRVAGKRRMKSFGTYSAARKAAEQLVKDLGTGSQVTALTPGRATDALAALERLEGYYQATGKKVSILAAVSAYCDSMLKLKDRTLDAAVEGYLSNVVTVKRIDLAKAVEDFLKEREPKTKAENGKRPQLSPAYQYIVAMWLREFAQTFPGTAVCDLKKELLNTYIASHSKVTARTRNGRRAMVRMFLKWCARQDYLSANHRLLEANGMIHERSEPESIEFYTPTELSNLLETARKRQEHSRLLPIIALCGLAGLRLQEAARLTWEDVFHVEGHIEVTRTKSKTRARRLVDICPALAEWLAPYRDRTGPVWISGLDKFHSDFGELRGGLRIPPRRNGLRHGFCTYHFAMHSDENLTAARAGNSPQMIHAHYKGLATETEAQKWFDVKPTLPTNVVVLTQAAKP